jgi:hypothetical protein
MLNMDVCYNACGDEQVAQVEMGGEVNLEYSFFGVIIIFFP